MPPAVTIEEFLRTIWGDQVGIAELTTIAPKSSKNFKPGQLDPQPYLYPDELPQLLIGARNKDSRSLNVYMGCALRREKWPRHTGRVGTDGKPEMEWRGTEANALSTRIVWVDLDFEGLGHKGRVVNEGATRKALAEFPKKPSIIVKSGGGIHVYWLLKEAAMGAELWVAKKVNRALGKFFGGDPIGDMARILRVPGTGNYNRLPAVNAQISWWHPEFEYVLDDFDFLPQPENVASSPVSTNTPTTTSTSIQNPTPQSPAPQSPVQPTTFEPRVTPTLQIPDDVIHRLGELLAAIWDEGARHYTALHVSGWFAGRQIVEASTKQVVAMASDKRGGDTGGRLKDVTDTYRNFELGKEVTGKTSLEQLIRSRGTPASQEAELKVLQEIQKLLPKPPRKKKEVRLEPDFEINKIVKFDSRPARYQVHIQKSEKEFVVPCELDVMTDIKHFRKSFFETSVNQFINSIAQWRWEQMISEAPVEVVPAPAEATTTGAIQTALDSWLDERREKPDPGELKTFPGYDDQELYFTLEGLKNRLKDRQIRCTDREITHILQDAGWKPTRDRRVTGTKALRLWTKVLNGHTNGNGHAPATDLPSVDLFKPDPSKQNSQEGPEGLD